MRPCIRTLLLTVALLCFTTPTASACIYIPILDPFYWLFGGCGYGCGGAGGGNYGYVNNGSTYGYGPNPHGMSRCVDDWLGYGYLRHQEGTLGHYPGRGFACYNPVFPRLLDPCCWFAHCPLFAPCGPAYGVAAPMVAPLAPPMPAPCHTPYAGHWPMPAPRFPMAPMMNPYAGNFNDPCAPQCVPQPAMQCQPTQIPVTTWRQVTVDRGSWQRVWVSRPVNMMVPQTHYVTAAPVMQMPMMQPPVFGGPMMDSSCSDGCGGAGSIMPGQDFMPGAEMMHGTGYPDMNAGPGCCGSDGGIPQQGFPQQGFPQGFQSGTPVAPQSTMLMSPGSMTMSHMSPQASMYPVGLQQPYHLAPYSSMSRWYSNPGYSNPGYASINYRQQMAGRPIYAMPMPGQARFGNPAYSTAMVQPRQPHGWQTGQPRFAQMQMAPMQMAQLRGATMSRQMMPSHFPAMGSRQPVSPLIGGTMPGAVSPRQNPAGDIYSTRERTAQAATGGFGSPNSSTGRSPIQQASWSQPARMSSAQRYPNSVQ